MQWVKVPRWWCDHLPWLSGAGRLPVLLVVRWEARYGAVWSGASVAAIVERSGLSRSVVQRALADLARPSLVPPAGRSGSYVYLRLTMRRGPAPNEIRPLDPPLLALPLLSASCGKPAEKPADGSGSRPAGGQSRPVGGLTKPAGGPIILAND